MKKSDIVKLKLNSRYTIVRKSGMGYNTIQKITLINAYYSQYAQYKNALTIIYKIKGGRTLLKSYNYNDSCGTIDFIMFEGWQDIDVVTYDKIDDISSHVLQKDLSDIMNDDKDKLSYYQPTHNIFDTEEKEITHNDTVFYKVSYILDIFRNKDLSNSDKHDLIIDNFRTFGLSVTTDIFDSLRNEYSPELEKKIKRLL